MSSVVPLEVAAAAAAISSLVSLEAAKVDEPCSLGPAYLRMECEIVQEVTK